MNLLGAKGFDSPPPSKKGLFTREPQWVLPESHFRFAVLTELSKIKLPAERSTQL